MADFDGNVRLGVSLDMDKKSLFAELSSITKEIQKVFNKELGKGISVIPSSFSSISKSVSKASKQISPMEQLTMQYQQQTEILDALNNKLEEYQQSLGEVGTALNDLTDNGNRVISPAATDKFGRGREYSIFKSLVSEETELRAKIAQVTEEIEAQKNVIADLANQLNATEQPKSNFFANVAQHANSLLSHLRNIKIESNKSGGSLASGFKRGLTSLIKVVFGVRTLFALFRKLRQSVIQAFETLATQFPEINHQMSELKTSLQGLKASFGTALQPLFSAIQPMLNSIIQKLTQAIELVGKFFAAITGQKYIYKATTAWQDYAGAVKGANRQLMAFDELNVLQDNNSGGGLSGVTYAKEALDDALKDLTAYEWGNLFGRKLQQALMNIDWPAIKQKARNIASYIAEFLNGFLETEINGITLGYTIGKTIAEAVNTGFEFLNTFFSTFHWASLGNFLADILNGLFNLDIGLIYSTISNFVNGLLRAFVSFIERVDWAQAGHKFMEAIIRFFTDIDWGQLVSTIMEGLGAALGALWLFFQGMAEELGKFLIDGLKNGIDVTLAGIATWIKEHIFDPFINGFKAVFGIASPSTVMAEMGVDLILGLLEGLKNTWNSITEFLSTALKSITDLITSAWTTIKTITTTHWTNIKTTVVSLWTGLKSILGAVRWDDIGKNLVSGLLNGIKSMWSSLTSWVSSKASALTSALKSAFRVQSPSKEWAYVGEMLGAGLQLGLGDSMDSVLDTVDEMSDSINSQMNIDSNGGSSLIPELDAIVGKLSILSDQFASIGASLHNMNISNIATGGLVPYQTQLAGAGASINPMQEFAEALSSLGNFTGNNPSGGQTIKIYIRGKEVFDAVVEENNSAIMRTGASPLVK